MLLSSVYSASPYADAVYGCVVLAATSITSKVIATENREGVSSELRSGALPSAPHLFAVSENRILD
jgi:hypothetical protein